MSTYTIKSVKKGNTWESSYGQMQSYALALDGVGEPVQLNKKVPVKTEPQVGDELHGTLEEQERGGRTYYKIKLDQQQSGFKGQPKDEAAIKAQFAIKTAVQLLRNPDAEVSAETIEHWAKEFYAMVERVKQS